MSFSGGTVVKKSSANPGDSRDTGSIPESEDPHSLDCKEPNTTECLGITRIYLSIVYDLLHVCKHTDILADAHKKKTLRQRY